MEQDLQARYREIAFSLLIKANVVSKGKAVVAIWRDNKHFENWLNNVDMENNKNIKLVIEDIPEDDLLVILATSDGTNLNIIYNMNAS